MSVASKFLRKVGLVNDQEIKTFISVNGQQTKTNTSSLTALVEELQSENKKLAKKLTARDRQINPAAYEEEPFNGLFVYLGDSKMEINLSNYNEKTITWDVQVWGPPGKTVQPKYFMRSYYENRNFTYISPPSNGTLLYQDDDEMFIKTPHGVSYKIPTQYTLEGIGYRDNPTITFSLLEEVYDYRQWKDYVATKKSRGETIDPNDRYRSVEHAHALGPYDWKIDSAFVYPPSGAVLSVKQTAAAGTVSTPLGTANKLQSYRYNGAPINTARFAKFFNDADYYYSSNLGVSGQILKAVVYNIVLPSRWNQPATSISNAKFCVCRDEAYNFDLIEQYPDGTVLRSLSSVFAYDGQPTTYVADYVTLNSTLYDVTDYVILDGIKTLRDGAFSEQYYVNGKTSNYSTNIPASAKDDGVFYLYANGTPEIASGYYSNYKLVDGIIAPGDDNLRFATDDSTLYYYSSIDGSTTPAPSQLTIYTPFGDYEQQLDATDATQWTSNPDGYYEIKYPSAGVVLFDVNDVQSSQADESQKRIYIAQEDSYADAYNTCVSDGLGGYTIIYPEISAVLFSNETGGTITTPAGNAYYAINYLSDGAGSYLIDSQYPAEDALLNSNETGGTITTPAGDYNYAINYTSDGTGGYKTVDVYPAEDALLNSNETGGTITTPAGDYNYAINYTSDGAGGYKTVDVYPAEDALLNSNATGGTITTPAGDYNYPINYTSDGTGSYKTVMQYPSAGTLLNTSDEIGVISTPTCDAYHDINFISDGVGGFVPQNVYPAAGSVLVTCFSAVVMVDDYVQTSYQYPVVYTSDGQGSYSGVSYNYPTTGTVLYETTWLGSGSNRRYISNGSGGYTVQLF